MNDSGGYQPQSFEAKWQAYWDSSGIYQAKDGTGQPKFYLLEFFPYPSGDGLSVGHSKNYVPCDAFCRFQRMRGFNVLHPMGWDAFGLPAENEAIIRQAHPRENTDKNAANYKRQMRLQGLSYDWSREIDASRPDYYRWTQWFFLMMYERGLAYRAMNAQWWCPKCQTILANEQVENGYCWRHGDQPVERKELEQWYFRITEYAEELLRDLDSLDWPGPILAMQRNWIGRSEGAEIEFEARTAAGETMPIAVFTTRPDTVFGATFLVLSPEHPAVEALTTAEHRGRVVQYQQEAGRETEIARLSTDREKTGVFTGAHAVNPFTGRENPIWIADYVLVTYGTGAIMAVPGHDERDHAFARKYSLPIVEVVGRPEGEASSDVFTGEGTMINSRDFDGLSSAEGKARIVEELERRGIGSGKVTFRMRDWLVSRQRYWGAPIPIVYCDACGIVPIPASDLPVLLPRVERYAPAGDGRSPLAAVPEFVNTTCPGCGGPAQRETDTLDSFVDSSWYFLRYCSPREETVPFDRAAVDYWAPIDLYVGGAEHAVMHLLYFRFFAKAMNDAGLIGFREPAPKLRNQGTMHAADGLRMSKSKGNVVTPDSVVEKYSADALRAHVMFMGPFDADADWDEQGIRGLWRWLNRVWNLVSGESDGAAKRRTVAPSDGLRRQLHRTLAKVARDVDLFRFNTAIAALMELTSAIERDCIAVHQDRVVAAGLEEIPEGGVEASDLSPPTGSGSWDEIFDPLLLMLAPLTPYIAEELWHRRGREGSIHLQPWPQFDPALAAEDTVKIVVQVNGKVRETLELPKGSDQATVDAAARAAGNVTRWLIGEPRKVIFVEDRLINFVV
jgi:leucyl-tRNA synthetase